MGQVIKAIQLHLIVVLVATKRLLLPNNNYEKMDSKIKRTFSTFTRAPYQDSIAVVLHACDFHLDQAVKDKENYALHMGLHYRLKSYLIDLKDYIHEKEQQEKISLSKIRIPSNEEGDNT